MCMCLFLHTYVHMYVIVHRKREESTWPLVVTVKTGSKPPNMEIGDQTQVLWKISIFNHWIICPDISIFVQRRPIPKILSLFSRNKNTANGNYFDVKRQNLPHILKKQDRIKIFLYGREVAIVVKHPAKI